jgi:methionyl-tRNA synthetase
VLGNDALRYYLLRETVFGQDGNFSRESLITRYNADLANGLGNLASRTLTMIANYCGGEVPSFVDFPTNTEWTSQEAAESRQAFIRDVCSAYENFQFSVAAEKIWQIVSHYGDEFLSTYKPWALAQDPTKKAFVEGVLYIALEAVRAAVVLAHPIIPEATTKIWAQLGQAEQLSEVRIDQLRWGQLNSGTKIGKPEAVFPRVDKKEAMERIEAMEQEIRGEGAAKPAATTPASSTGAGAPAAAASPDGAAKIAIDDFAKVELRVGQVKSAEKVAGADKLLKLLIDIGDEVRQIVAGIAVAYQPEELIGRKVVIVANLAPRKLRGVESNGMIVAASTGDGKPVLCTFTEDVPVGARLK